MTGRATGRGGGRRGRERGKETEEMKRKTGEAVEKCGKDGLSI